MKKLYAHARVHGELGLTLVELLMAMAISGLVAAAAYSVFQSTGSASRVSENVTAVQMNLRAAMDVMSRDIRQAGFGLKETPETISFTNTGAAVVVNGTSVAGGGTIQLKSPIAIGNSSTGPDTLTILGVGHFAGYLERANDADHSGDNDCNEPGDDVLCLSSAEEFKNTSGNFVPNRKYLSVAGMFFMELDGTASNHDLTKKRFKLASSSDLVNGNYKNADKIPVYIIQAVQYSIATDLDGCSATNPCLAMRDFSEVRGGSTRQVVAQHIEDLQLAYGVDVNPRDRMVDYPASGYTEGAFMSSPAVDPLGIVAVRLNLLGKTPVQDVKESTASVRPALEDHSAGTTADRYKRRTLTKVIKIRNPRS